MTDSHGRGSFDRKVGRQCAGDRTVAPGWLCKLPLYKLPLDKPTWFLVFVQSYRQLEWVNEPRRRQPPKRCPPLLPDSAATPGTDSLGTSENRRFGALRTGNFCVSWR